MLQKGKVCEGLVLGLVLVFSNYDFAVESRFSCVDLTEFNALIYVGVSQGSAVRLYDPVSTATAGSYGDVHRSSSGGYLSPTGSIETAALRELQAFAGKTSSMLVQLERVVVIIIVIIIFIFYSWYSVPKGA